MGLPEQAPRNMPDMQSPPGGRTTGLAVFVAVALVVDVLVLARSVPASGALLLPAKYPLALVGAVWARRLRQGVHRATEALARDLQD